MPESGLIAIAQEFDPYMSLHATRQAYLDGRISVFEHIKQVLDRIDQRDKEYRAFVRVFHDQALADAMRADALLASGVALPPLLGIPFGVKDNIDVAGVPTTAQCAALAHNMSRQTANCVQQLISAGAILVGKLALEELAIGSPLENSLFAAPRNPWNADVVSGGSSSGSAVAVAAGLVPFALGSDTAGSVRAPAAYCGVFALKPTSGRINAEGLMPLAPSLDTIGVITRTADDCEAVFAVLTGQAHPQSEHVPHERAIIIAEVDDRGSSSLNPEVAEAITSARSILESLVQAPISLVSADLQKLYNCGSIVLRYESFHTYKPLLQASPHLLCPTTRNRLERGAAIPQSEYLAARGAAKEAILRIDECFKTSDFLITPVSFSPPAELTDADAVARCDDVFYRLPFNVSGHPVVSFCIGLSSAGLPIAMQLVGKHGEDERLLALAGEYQRCAAWCIERHGA